MDHVWYEKLAWPRRRISTASAWNPVFSAYKSSNKNNNDSISVQQVDTVSTTLTVPIVLEVNSDSDNGNAVRSRHVDSNDITSLKLLIAACQSTRERERSKSCRGEKHVLSDNCLVNNHDS